MHAKGHPITATHLASIWNVAFSDPQNLFRRIARGALTEVKRYLLPSGGDKFCLYCELFVRIQQHTAIQKTIFTFVLRGC